MQYKKFILIKFKIKIKYKLISENNNFLLKFLIK